MRYTRFDANEHKLITKIFLLEKITSINRPNNSHDTSEYYRADNSNNGPITDRPDDQVKLVFVDRTLSCG